MIKKGHRIAYLIKKNLICEGTVINTLGEYAKIRWKFFSSHQFENHTSEESMNIAFLESVSHWDENYNGWIQQKGGDWSRFEIKVAKEGFEYIGTGGGCDAYYLRLPKGYSCLVTEFDGDHKPEKASEKCTFGLFHGEWGEEEEFYFHGPFSFVLNGGVDWLETIKAKKLIRRK